jgi:thiol-disulfide isomerase/thioredoxin
MRSRTLVILALAVCASAFVATGVAAEKKEKEYPALEVGSIPFDEIGKDVDGNPVTVSEHHGKVIIVSFWASCCGPCRKELPVLANVAKHVGPDHLKLIAINYKDEPKPFKAVAGALKTLPIIVVRDASGKAARKYKVQGIPRMIIIDRSGKVAADHTGYGEDSIGMLVEELNRVLQETT